MVSEQRKIQHLFLRAGFGETPAGLRNRNSQTLAALTEKLFTDSEKFRDLRYLPYPLNESQEKKGVTPFLFVKMILKSRKEMEELNTEWLFKMTHTPAVLREKLTFFWHNHFATSVPFAYLMQEQNNLLRRHALGKFGVLLHAVAKDPAMLLYLNNQENKKDHPNENFAREVMELFTLGIGHYTEKDIREAARAFTGWTVNAHGQFVFQEAVHDDGEKEFLGRKGRWKGEDILDMLLAEKQTAYALASKFYREFVNPEINPDRVSFLADEYYRSGYDTEKLMRTILFSDWFYDEENIGVKIASPVELIVRYKKLVDLDFPAPVTLLNLQRALGQVLFFPPNVSGWKGGTAWIDSTSLMIRLSLPQAIVEGRKIGLQPKPAFEEEETASRSKGAVVADWSPLLAVFGDVPADARTGRMLDSFIQCSHASIRPDMIRSGMTAPDSSDIIRELAGIMSLPEFQLI